MRETLDFLLFDWLGIDALCAWPRFADHSRESFTQVLDMAQRLAAEKFAPFNRLSDTQEPHVDGEQVVLPAPTVEAMRALLASGLIAATHDYADAGMQLPTTVAMAANGFVSKASVGMSGYAMLTTGNAGLLMAHGTAAQKQVFAAAELRGEWTGTMCLSEPGAGSSLGDITTRAVEDGPDHAADPLGPRYRLFGNKMWISGGDHEIAGNIVHLVLAKIPGPDGALPPGVKGISLFIVPKRLVDPAGALTGARNDVALAGLNHKLGYRGTTNTLLNFGEGKYPVGGAPGAIGYRVGAPGEGLKCMFHMMNEARIGVGVGAVMLGYAGYEASLDYARTRLQGRTLAGGKDPAQKPVPIIRHADVKRMLLAQKSFVEGGLALGLFCAKLSDESHYAAPAQAAASLELLELLVPVVKSWPSEWCLEANSLAIQILGGYGYTRDFPVEQYWRDNRLNMIHEGTHGIQALDLLGRKAIAGGGRALAGFLARLEATAARADAVPELAAHAAALRAAGAAVARATQQAWERNDPEAALANAAEYLRGFGHVVVAWLWLDVALAARQAAASAFTQGKLAAARYFFVHELPKALHWLALAGGGDTTVRAMEEAWF